MRLYAIRHKPTGQYLPWPNERRRGRGGSQVEPEAPEKARLFRSARSASIALTAWLAGRVERLNEHGEFTGDFRFIKVPSRRREEMDIVEVELALP